MGKTGIFVISEGGFGHMEREAGRRLMRHLLWGEDERNGDYFEVDKAGLSKTGDLWRFRDYDVFIFIYGILFITRQGIHALSSIAMKSEEFSVVVPVSNESRIPRQKAAPPFLYQTVSVLDWAASELYEKTGDEVVEVAEVDDFCFALRKDSLQKLPGDCELANLPGLINDMKGRFGIATGVYAHRYGDCYESARDDLMVHVPLDARDILDVGSAAGLLGELLKKRQGCSVTGVDVDNELIEIARKRLDAVLAGDIEDLIAERKLGTYDCIVCGDVLEHLNDPWKVVAGLKTHLKRGGLFIASTPNVMNWAVIYEQLMGRWDYVPFSILSGTHVRFFTKKTLTELFEDAGYRTEAVLLQSFEIPPRGMEFIKLLRSISPDSNDEELKASEIVIIAKAM